MLGHLPKPRHAAYRAFADADGHAIDRGIAVFFPAPHSFTGEHVLELHGHGGMVVLDTLLRRVLALGARLARPGEFSERAFLNGKMDLAQAEAVADLIDSASAAAARSAMRSLHGEFSSRVHEAVDGVVRLRTYVEAAIDFPEEEIDFLADDRIPDELAAIDERLGSLLRSARQGCLLQEGMTVVLAGRPNVGKSSLLNRLAQYDAAIVSSTPGTTRDVLRERIRIGDMPLHIVDTAGLRESGDDVETEGVRRAKNAMERADRILLVVDDAAPEGEVTITEADGTQDGPGSRQYLPATPPRTVIRNKIDLTGRRPGIAETADGVEIALSAKTGQGLDLLREHLQASMGYQPPEAGTFIARRRHLDAIERARGSVLRASDQFAQTRAGEFLAEELRQAQNALNEITGEFTSEDLLERIFSNFCVGK